MSTAGFIAYRKFLAMKLHYTSESYSFVKYHGIVNASESKFMQRNDRYFYDKLAKKECDLDLFLAISLFYNPKIWVGSLFENDIDKLYRKHAARILSLESTFTHEISRYDSLNEAFTIKENEQYPKMYIDYREKKISLETLIVCDKVLTIFDYWSTIISDTVIWPRERFRIRKYGEFISIDRNKYNDIMKRVDT